MDDGGSRLKQFNDLRPGADTEAFCDGWAASYDRELGAAGYAAPGRCAAALAALAPDRHAPLLDVGCGPASPARRGFRVLDGVDYSKAMLAQARSKGDLLRPGARRPREALAVSPGRLPARRRRRRARPRAPAGALIDRVNGNLVAGGLFAFSFSDRARRDDASAGRLTEHRDAGPVEVIFREIDGFLLAEVYVLRRR